MLSSDFICGSIKPASADVLPYGSINGFWTKAAPYIKLMSLSGTFSSCPSSLRKWRWEDGTYGIGARFKLIQVLSGMAHANEPVAVSCLHVYNVRVAHPGYTKA
ncbi:hypothetical protein PMIN06_008741 [Paraphaeosphaeria minitans]